MLAANAKEILTKYWDKSIPIDPIKLARAAGAAVEAIPNLSTSGEFKKCTARGPLIQYRSTESNVRQRFTIAHELGHFVLGHGGAYRDSPDEFSLTNHNPLEIEANRFAAELLMPEDVLSYLVVKKGINDIAKLADMLQVSQVAMQYRLKNLGWIS